MKWIFILIFTLFLVGCAQDPTVTVLDYPSSVSDDKPFVVKWDVQGAGDIDHTAIHFDYQSKGADFKSYSEVSAIYTGSAPQEFSGNIHAIKVGFVYFRAHAIIAKEHYYSQEYKVEVQPYVSHDDIKEKSCPVCLEPAAWGLCIDGTQKRQIYVCDEETNFLCQDRFEDQECNKKPVEVISEIMDLNIDVSDRFFSPNEFEIEPGQKLRITFTAVSPQTFGGADIRDTQGLVKTGRISRGAHTIVELTMPNEDLKLTNYWPASSRRKTDMVLKVKK